MVIGGLTQFVKLVFVWPQIDQRNRFNHRLVNGIVLRKSVHVYILEDTLDDVVVKLAIELLHLQPFWGEKVFKDDLYRCTFADGTLEVARPFLNFLFLSKKLRTGLTAIDILDLLLRGKAGALTFLISFDF